MLCGGAGILRAHSGGGLVSMRFLGTRFGPFVAVVLTVVVVGGAVAVAVPGRSHLSSAAQVTQCSDDLKAWIYTAGRYRRLHIELTFPAEFGPATGVTSWIDRRAALKAPVTEQQRRANKAVPNVRHECSSLVSKGVDVAQFPPPYAVSSPKSRSTSVKGTPRSSPRDR